MLLVLIEEPQQTLERRPLLLISPAAAPLDASHTVTCDQLVTQPADVASNDDVRFLQ